MGVICEASGLHQGINIQLDGWCETVSMYVGSLYKYVIC